MSENAISIGDGTSVTLHFSLTLDDGSEVDSNFNAEPATFTFGDGQLLHGFEKALIGLTAGDEGSFSIPPEEGFGQPNDNNVQTVKRQSFAPGMELAEGLVVSFADAAGGELPGVIKSFDDETVYVDFNHPLAGRVITFFVKVISVAPSVQH